MEKILSKDVKKVMANGLYIITNDNKILKQIENKNINKYVFKKISIDDSTGINVKDIKDISVINNATWILLNNGDLYVNDKSYLPYLDNHKFSKIPNIESIKEIYRYGSNNICAVTYNNDVYLKNNDTKLLYKKYCNVQYVNNEIIVTSDGDIWYGDEIIMRTRLKNIKKYSSGNILVDDTVKIIRHNQIIDSNINNVENVVYNNHLYILHKDGSVNEYSVNSDKIINTVDFKCKYIFNHYSRGMPTCLGISKNNDLISLEHNSILFKNIKELSYTEDQICIKCNYSDYLLLYNGYRDNWFQYCYTPSYFYKELILI